MPTGRLIDVALPSVQSPNFKAESVAALRKLIDQLNTQLGATGTIADNVITNLSKDAYYAARFTVDDWQGPDADGYYLTIAHNLNTYNISVDLWAESFETRVLVFADVVAKITANVVKVWVSNSPDHRFAGRIFVMARPETTASSGVVTGTVTGTGNNGTGTFNPSEAIRLEQPFEIPYGRGSGPLPNGFNSSGTIRISFLASRDRNIWEGFQLLGGTDPNNLSLLEQNGVFAYAGTLARAYQAGTLEVDDTVGILLTPANTTHFAEFYQFGGNEARADLFTYQRRICIINGEIMAIQRITAVSGGRYLVTGVLRGLLDTKPSTHAGGSKVFFWREYDVPFTINNPGAWDNAVTLTLKAVPYTTSQEALPASMSTSTLTITKRAVRPYAVQNLAVDGNGSNPTYQEGVAGRLTWLARHRDNNGALDDTGYDFESGIDFVVRVYDPDGNQIGSPVTVANTETVADAWGVTRLYYDFTIAAGGFEYVVVRVNARLNGLESLDTLNTQQITVRRAV
jgi:hypothetical protein